MYYYLFIVHSFPVVECCGKPAYRNIPVLQMSRSHSILYPLLSLTYKHHLEKAPNLKSSCSFVDYWLPSFSPLMDVFHLGSYNRSYLRLRLKGKIVISILICNPNSNCWVFILFALNPTLASPFACEVINIARNTTDTFQGLIPRLCFYCAQTALHGAMTARDTPSIFKF